MKNLNVSAKLFVSFLIVIALAVIVGVLGIIGTWQMNTAMDRSYFEETVPMGSAAYAVEYVQRLRVQMRNAVIYYDDHEHVGQVKSDIQTREAALRAYLADYEKTIGPEQAELRKLFDAVIVTLNNDVMPELYDLVALAEGDVGMDVLKDAMEAATPASDQLRNDILSLMEMNLNAAETANHDSEVLFNTLLALIIIALVLAVAVAVFLAMYISGLISKPLNSMMGYIKQAGETGNLKFTDAEWANCDHLSKIKDEIGQTMKAFTTMMRKFVYYGETVTAVSRQDLTVTVDTLGANDTFGNAISNMVGTLNNIFHEIQVASAQVSTGSKQVADGAQSLAQGSTEQAASIEQLSSSISDIAAKTKGNAQTAERTARLSETIKDSAEKGSRQMGDMITAVKDINDASQSISKIIKTIDDIAFQTNILALNAAVEAARAGQHGKGFAVVAEEVRNLASKSAEAAKDTGIMIQNSMEKAELGTRIAGETATSLNDIVIGINESGQLVAEIANASQEQSQGISQINIGIDQVAQVVQQNSATAEQSAAASEQMNSQSSLLEELIAQFRLKDENSSYRGLPAPYPGRGR